jgi:SpoVK/Ycf46/Vps4 family AAA+-type ATPase
MWIGWSADRLAKVFVAARAKQPSLIFIDEIDAVCPIRGAYHDAISQEFTAQLLQEIDGLLSDSQAIFLVGATNRADQVDSAILSRFSERIEVPLPDATTRLALLELFLSPLPFGGDRVHIIRRLASATDGASGRDLRATVNKAVLAAVKRSSSPRDFELCENDFASEEPANIQWHLPAREMNPIIHPEAEFTPRFRARISPIGWRGLGTIGTRLPRNKKASRKRTLETPRGL